MQKMRRLTSAGCQGAVVPVQICKMGLPSHQLSVCSIGHDTQILQGTIQLFTLLQRLRSDALAKNMDRYTLAKNMDWYRTIGFAFLCFSL